MKEKYRKLKANVYRVIGPPEKGNKASVVFEIVLSVLVFISCGAVFVDLLQLMPNYQRELEIFEYVVVGIFILEYLVRVWTSEFAYPECKSKLAAVKEYITSFDSLIDLLSIFSVLLNGIPKELAIFRLVKLLKLVKLVRLVKVAGYVQTDTKFQAKMKKIQRRVNEVIDKGEEHDRLSKIYDVLTVLLILTSVSFIIVETFPISPAAHHVLYVIEMGIACLFAIEYVLRVWTAPMDYPEMRPDKARMKYIFSFMSLIDLLSIVPVFVAGLPNATGILKIFKLCKILRLVKASRYLSGVANFGRAIQAKKKQIVLSFVSICVMILICSVLIYSVEHDLQPEVFTNGLSGIEYSVTILVEGETEMAPMTTFGKAMSTIMLLLGGCMFGVPVAIVATGFEDMVVEQAGDENDEAIYTVLRAYDKFSDTQKQKAAAYIRADLESLSEDNTDLPEEDT